jgi:hypothetical protein
MRLILRVLMANLFSRINEPEENAAVAHVNRNKELVRQSRTQNGEPVRAKAGAEQIRLYLQSPADVIRRPGELKLTVR